MTALILSFVLLALLVAAIVRQRAREASVIDFLSPMMALFIPHYVVRAWILEGEPSWSRRNPIVAFAYPGIGAECLAIVMAAALAFVAAYLWVDRHPVTQAAADLRATGAGVPAVLLALGLGARAILRADRVGWVALPSWMSTPIETFGWAALAGLVVAGFGSVAARGQELRIAHRALAFAGLVAVVVVDGRFLSSREAVLQPLVCVLFGWWLGARWPLRRFLAVALFLGLPLFVWIGAQKTWAKLTGEAATTSNVHSPLAVWAEAGGDVAGELLSGVLDRLHGLDSLVAVRNAVPGARPHEEGSVWLHIAVSAFVPRAILPSKNVGWGTRFAVEFWGAPETSRGAAAVGISHLGLFYLYGGTFGAIADMALFGALLAAYARYLKRRGDLAAYTLFALTLLTVLQIERDPEVAFGGVLKVLALFLIMDFVFLGRRGRRRRRGLPGVPGPRRGGLRRPEPASGTAAARIPDERPAAAPGPS